MLATRRPYIMAFYQNFASAPISITDRKRKEMDEESTGPAFDEVAERRKVRQDKVPPCAFSKAAIS